MATKATLKETETATNNLELANSLAVVEYSTNGNERAAEQADPVFVLKPIEPDLSLFEQAKKMIEPVKMAGFSQAEKAKRKAVFEDFNQNIEDFPVPVEFITKAAIELIPRRLSALYSVIEKQVEAEAMANFNAIQKEFDSLVKEVHAEGVKQSQTLASDRLVDLRYKKPSEILDLYNSLELELLDDNNRRRIYLDDVVKPEATKRFKEVCYNSGVLELAETLFIHCDAVLMSLDKVIGNKSDLLQTANDLANQYRRSHEQPVIKFEVVEGKSKTRELIEAEQKARQAEANYEAGKGTTRERFLTALNRFKNANEADREWGLN